MNERNFSSRTTAATVAKAYDQECWKGRVVMITGTTNGIGYETLRAFAQMQNAPTLIVANRNVETSKEKTKSLVEQNKDLVVHHVQLDLASLESVRNCANEVKQLGININVLILNAGVFISKYERSAEGYEKHFAINHLGHFTLTNELLSVLVDSATDDFLSRVVVVASHSHYQGEINFRQLPLSIDTFGSIVTQKAYAQSKLCNVLFANELNRRMIAQGLPVRANSLHPATLVYSNLGNESSLVRFFMGICSYFTRTLEQAAATSVFCALAEELENKGGEYYDACSTREPSDTAKDETIAARLWEVSTELSLPQ